MLRLQDVLQPRHVILDIDADNRSEAISELLRAMRGDPRLIDAEEFGQVFMRDAVPKCEVIGCGLIVPHLRTDLVNAMITAFGRMKAPIESPPFSYILLVALPHAMASDYLRIIGSVCRSFNNPRVREQIDLAKDGREVLGLLSKDLK